MDIDEQYDKLYRYCFFKLRNRETAEDLTQEAFLRFMERGGGRDGRRTLAYLYTIARNLCVDEFRRKRTEPLNDEFAAEDEEEPLLDSLDMKAALSRLTEEDRELILLRYVNEVPVGDVSRLLGISRFAVYRRTNSCLKQLKGILGKEEG